jgi:hypothetical protein
MEGLIEKVIKGEKTIEEVEQLYEKEFNNYQERHESFNWIGYLGLSKQEATAYAQGATVEDIVNIRKTGWPDHCPKCNNFIDYKKFGWIFIPNETGSIIIRHIKCPIP